MAQIKKISLVLASLGLLGASAAQAIDIQAGDWKLGIGGNVNGFMTSNSCQSGTGAKVVGGLACAGDSNIGIQNGLLPNEISFTASTRQDDLDISATISLWPTIDTTAAGQTGTGSGTPGTGLNTRQGFFTFGDKSWGSVKIGRDLGLFGSDAILSDMTLLSVGAGSGGFGGPTTLGRIGAGYLYADWIPQITYSTPNLSGFNASVGVFQGLSDLGGNYNAVKQPGFQAKASYDFAGSGVGGKVWVGVLSQQLSSTAAVTTGTGASAVTTGGIPGYTADAFEIGAKVDAGDFEGVGYYYNGSGVGTTLLFLLGNDAAGNKRDSSGGYVQGTYKINKVKLGLSYGQSKLNCTGGDAGATCDSLLDTNTSGIASIYYSLTKSITLVAEYIDTESKNHAGAKNTQNTVAVGGIMFF